MVRTPVLVLIVSWFTLATSLRAEAPLDSVPNTADIIIRLKNPEATIEKVARFAESIETGTGNLVRDRADELGRYISNATLSGVDQNQDWYVVVFADSQTNPGVVFVIPASDADAMQEALPEAVSSFVRDGWVFYSDDEQAIKDLSSATGSALSISTEFDEQSRSLFEGGDVALFVNVDHLTEVYDEKILAAQDDIASLMNQLEFAAPQTQGLDLSAALDMYSGLLSGVFQALEDARGLTVALVVEDAGMDYDVYLDFGSQTPTSEHLSNQPVSSMQRLAVLPPEAQLYYGLSGDFAGFMQWGMNTLSMLAGTPDSREELDKLAEQFDDLDFPSFAGSLKIGGAGGGMMQTMTVAEVSPVSAAREIMRSMTELVGTIEMEGLRQETILERDAEDFGEYTADHVSIEQDFDFGPNLPPQMQQQMEQMQQMMYGPDGYLTRIVYLEDYYLQSLGGGRRAVEETLDRIDSGEENDSAEHRQELMEESNLLVLMDVPGLVSGWMGAFAGMAGGQLPGMPQIEGEPSGSSYVGIAVRADSNAVVAEIHVPVEQIRGLLPFVALLQMMGQQGGAAF